MGRLTFFGVTLRIVLMISTVRANSANVTNVGAELEIAGEHVDGWSLIRMGEIMKSTMLKLLGRAFVNIDRNINQKTCEVDPCDQWSPWSECTARVANTFGFRSRARVCWHEKHGACNRTGEQTVENDNHVCEGRCPSSYTLYNATNVCVKYFSEYRNQSAAENVCAHDGGHLLNTDTEEKWNACVSILRSYNANGVLIDGTRTSVSAKWVFMNGKDPEANGVKSKWLPGQPSNGSFELCRVMCKSSGTYYWYDNPCNWVYNFICEVI